MQGRLVHALGSEAIAEHAWAELEHAWANVEPEQADFSQGRSGQVQIIAGQSSKSAKEHQVWYKMLDAASRKKWSIFLNARCCFVKKVLDFVSRKSARFCFVQKMLDFVSRKESSILGEMLLENRAKVLDLDVTGGRPNRARKKNLT